MRAQNRSKVIEHIASLDNFQVGNVRAWWYPTPLGVPTGRLAPEHVALLRQLHPDVPVYVIFSYATPLAWRVPGGSWTVPEARYSVTTGQHLSLARQGMREQQQRFEQAASEVFVSD